jgi:hypothetical protein
MNLDAVEAGKIPGVGLVLKNPARALAFDWTRRQMITLWQGPCGSE